MLSTHWFGRRGAAFISCVCVAVGCALVAQAESKTLRLRADSWMPYNGDPAGELPGYVVELARAVFSAHGITIDYQTMPWTDALKAVKAGEIDGVIGANATEAEGLVRPAEATGLPRVGLYVRKDSALHFENLASLKNSHLGVIESYSYWDNLDEYIKTHAAPAVVLFKGDTPLIDGIAKLDTGEIDVMAETFVVWSWALRSLNRKPSDFRTICVQNGDPIYVAFAPGKTGTGYAKIWDDGIRELRKNGKLAAIMGKYGLADWQESK